MKPTFHSAADARRHFPPTDYYFQSAIGTWRGYSPDDDEDKARARDFYSLSREFMTVCARERAKEMWVFGLVVLAAAWPVIYMLIVVVKLLIKGRPLD